MSIYDADVIVIGGGVIGLCAALYSSKKGASVILLEKSFVGTQSGSSAEHLRMWRTMYTELDHAVLSYKAGDLYREIEKETGVKLIHQKGLLNFGIESDYTPEGTLMTTLPTYDKLGKKYTMLSSKQLETRYCFKNLPEEYIGIYQEDNAVIDVKKTLQTLLEMSKMRGIEIKEYTDVEKLVSEANGVEVITNEKTYYAKKVILATGPFSNQLMEKSFKIKLNLLLWDMCFSYYRIADTNCNYPMWFQFEKPKNGYSNLFYGFPNMPFGREGFLRIAVDWASHTFREPMERQSSPPLIDIQITQDYVKNHLRGVDHTPIDMGLALMAHLPDNYSVLDFMPDQVPYHKNIIMCCAGWAFKFAPLFGKICAELAIDGQSSENISSFSINRESVLI